MNDKEQEFQAKDFAIRTKILADSMLALARCIIEGNEFGDRSYRESIVLWYDTVGRMAIAEEYIKRFGCNVENNMAREIQLVSSGSVKWADDFIQNVHNRQQLQLNSKKPLLQLVRGGKLE